MANNAVTKVDQDNVVHSGAHTFSANTTTFSDISLSAAGSVADGTTKRPMSATFTPAVGATNVSLVTIQLVDGGGTAVAGVFNIDVWLSDAATGVAPSGTTASGAVTAGASGVVLGTYTTKQSLRMQTTAAGLLILSITDTAKTTFRVCCNIPDSGATVVSAALTAANYG